MTESLFAAALSHHEAGRRAEAEAGYRAVLASEPDHPDSLHLLGLLQVEANDPARGLGLIRRAMQLNPGRASFHNSLGQAYMGLGQPEEALSAFLAASSLLPGRAEIHNNIGTVLSGLGRRSEAIGHYRQAAGYAPDCAQIWFNLANALATDGSHGAAEEAFGQALALSPDFAAAQANYGRLLMDMARWQEAETALMRALTLLPTQPQAWINLGIVRHERDTVSAEACFRKALLLQPDSAEAHFNLGCLLSGQNRIEEALQCHRDALHADPGFAPARIAGCMAHLPVLYRTEDEIGVRRAQYATALRALVQADPGPELARAIGTSQPFFLPYQEQDDRELQALYGRFACRLLAETAGPVRLTTWRGGRIRVGIVSGFFCDHTLFKLFLESWIGCLDRTRFEVIGFHTGRTADEQTAWCATRCDQFVQGLGSAAAWQQAITAHQPHVLLYPEIGMDPVAGQLAAMRLAPVQCVAWGQPVTSGLPTIDFFLTAGSMEPPGADDRYTERLVRLPGLGTCYRPDAALLPRQHSRQSPAPNDRAPVFWSGQALYKYLPRYDSVFPRIARELGPCQFVFIGFGKSAAVTEMFRDRLAQAFASFGLDAGQHVVIVPPLSQADYLQAMSQADIVLDTPGWSGGKSTLDCLVADPAIVTLTGRFMRGRHTAAILRHIGCPETVTQSLDDYVATAVRLARDAGWREAVRKRVAEGKHRAYEDVSVVRALETVLHNALQQAMALAA